MSDYLIIIRDLDGKALLEIPASVFAAMAFTDNDLPTVTTGTVKVSVKKIEADPPGYGSQYESATEAARIRKLERRTDEIARSLSTLSEVKDRYVASLSGLRQRLEVLEARIANGEPPWRDAGPQERRPAGPYR